MECSLVPKAGFQLETLDPRSFRRGFTPKDIWHNLTGAYHTARSLGKARRLIRTFQPDVIVGTGGYASFPLLKEGARMGVPTCIHESNAVPGLTTRMVADQMDRILVSFAESQSQYKRPERVQVVGMPVRQEFLYTKKEDARQALGLDERPVIVSAWGSLGAREMNKVIAEFFPPGAGGGMPLPAYPCHRLLRLAMDAGLCQGAGVDLPGCSGLEMVEYLYDMPTWMAAADLVIGRAGASTLNEIAASGTPCIIVPSPNVTDNHQEKTPGSWQTGGRRRSFTRRTVRARPSSGRPRFCWRTLPGAGPCAGRC